MKKSALRPEELEAVFPVPPLARSEAGGRPLDFEQNDRLVRHIRQGGLTRLMYGGNAFVYHLTLAEYEALVDWLVSLPDDFWPIPSVGPSFGRAMDQAPILRRAGFPTAMALPCGDPRDPAGLYEGLREIAAAAGMPLILYLKDENNFGADREAGLDAVAKLVDEGVCVAIKYAVVRQNPAEDAYLTSLLRRVERRRVISGIGERPAITHMREFGLPGFTTGSGCLAPRLSGMLHETCEKADYEGAALIRARFLPLEDLRDASGPARVLHHATEEAGIARTGPIPPFVSRLGTEQRQQLAPVAVELAAHNRSFLASAGA
jgi:dihydrodipicolinate synthase/N-acetylneuraminate lyase